MISSDGLSITNISVIFTSANSAKYSWKLENDDDKKGVCLVQLESSQMDPFVTCGKGNTIQLTGQEKEMPIYVSLIYTSICVN